MYIHGSTALLVSPEKLDETFKTDMQMLVESYLVQNHIQVGVVFFWG